MKTEVPAIAGRLFARLTHGDDLLLSRNGPNEDAELFAQLEADEPGCEAYAHRQLFAPVVTACGSTYSTGLTIRGFDDGFDQLLLEHTAWVVRGDQAPRQAQEFLAILLGQDDRCGIESMPRGVSGRDHFADLGFGAGALESVLPIGLNLFWLAIWLNYFCHREVSKSRFGQGGVGSKANGRSGSEKSILIGLGRNDYPVGSVRH